MSHELALEGPISYPGGKDGFFQGSCSCGRWTSGLAPRPDVEQAWGQHHEAKQKERIMSALDEMIAANGYPGGDVRIVVNPEHPRQIEIIVRPKYSSRTFLITAKVEQVKEL